METENRRNFIRNLLRWAAGLLLALTSWAALRGEQACSRNCSECQRSSCKQRNKTNQ